MMKTNDIDFDIRSTIEARTRSGIKNMLYTLIHERNLKYDNTKYEYKEDTCIRHYMHFYSARAIIFLICKLDAYYSTDVYTYMNRHYTGNYLENITFEKLINLFLEEVMKSYDKSE